MPVAARPPAERLWARLAEGGPDECWLWPGATYSNGYGHIGGASGSHLAHRVAYESRVGVVPPDRVLDHRCGNRACCNPQHLRVVTQAANCQSGRKSKHRALVVAIRLAGASTSLPWSTIGEMFGVPSATAYSIGTGRRWS